MSPASLSRCIAVCALAAFAAACSSGAPSQPSSAAASGSPAATSTANPVQKGDDAKDPNPCSLLTAADIQHALGVPTVHGDSPLAVEHNDHGISWVRECTFMVTGNDEAHAVLVDTEQFSSTQALVGYKDLASWSEGLDAVQRSLSDVGQQATLAVVKPTGIGSVVALESNVVVTITVKGIDYPGGDYTTALTALTKAAVSRL